MNEKLLKWIIYIAGIASLYAFVSIRSLPVMNLTLKEKLIPEHFEFTKYGELYYFNNISHFKEILPEPIRKYRLSEKQPDIKEAGILVFGDSFLDMSRQVTLPERISDTLGLKVYFHRYFDPNVANPVCVLSSMNYTNANSKFIIDQVVERNIPYKFNEPFTTSNCGSEKVNYSGSAWERGISIIFPRNTEEIYTMLLRRSIFTSEIYTVLATKKFDWFGYISSYTPKYKVGEQPWLFYYKVFNDGPGGYYYRYTQEEIDRYCDNIAYSSKMLKELYNLDLILLLVPTKYTIYHGVLNDDPYNNLLPEIDKGLTKRNIPYVELYSDFSSSKELLYYGTDSHWNKKGVDIALRKTIDKMNELKQK